MSEEIEPLSITRCNECGGPAGIEVYSSDLRRWRWWCRHCLFFHRDHAALCDVALCGRVATRVALDGDGVPFALCDPHRPFARFMDRLR